MPVRVSLPDLGHDGVIARVAVRQGEVQDHVEADGFGSLVQVEAVELQHALVGHDPAADVVADPRGLVVTGVVGVDAHGGQRHAVLQVAGLLNLAAQGVDLPGGKGVGLLFRNGEVIRKVPEEELLAVLVEEAEKYDQ